MRRRRGRIRIKTLVKFLRLYGLTVDRNRPLSLDEIVQELGCSKGNAYNYRRALGVVLPSWSFSPSRVRRRS